MSLENDTATPAAEAPAPDPHAHLGDLVTSQPDPEPEPPAPAAAAEPVATPEPVKEEPKTVPLAALHEERQRRQELQRRFEERDAAEKAERAKLQERLDALAKRFEPAPTPEPTFNDDPAAFLKAETEAAKQQIAEFRAWKQAQEEQAQQQAHMQRFDAQITASEREFAPKAPDYTEAVAWLRNLRETELRDLYGVENPAERARIINQDIAALAARALQANKNPAEQAYNLAKLRGWASKAPAAAAPVAPPATDKIDTIAKGQAAARTPSAAAGVAPPSLTIESLAKMSEDDFSKLSDAEFRRVMGGA